MKKITLLSLVILLFLSCAGVGYLAGGKNTTFEGNYVLENKGSIEKSMSKLKIVLYSNGWNKSNEDGNIISFQNQSSKGSEFGIGKYNFSTIRATFTQENIKLQITQIGNFKKGTEKEVNKIFLEIKEQYKLN